jgi:hypothetical protein
VRLALCTLVVAAVLGTGATSQALAAPACPKLTRSQIAGSIGFRFVSVETRTANVPNLWSLYCFYTLSRNASVTFQVYKGTHVFASVKAQIDETIGTDNMNANNAVPGTCTPAWGQCEGTTYNGHESPLAGLGEEAVAFPGNKLAGALVMFIANGETFVVESSGPYGQPGPDQARLVAFSRLVLRSHFSLAG